MKSLTTLDQLKVGDVVEAKADHAPYVVMFIEDSLYPDSELETSGDHCLVDGEWFVVNRKVYFENASGHCFSTDSGLFYRLGSLPQVTFASNARRMVHAMLGERPICGHRSTQSFVSVRIPPTCQDCRRILEK